MIDTNYIVSGFMRTGTSMMMRCLANSGLEAAYSVEENQIKDIRFGTDTYRPNVHGYFELPGAQYYTNDYKQYSGKLIKLMLNGLFTLPVGNYKIAFMRRDPEEIRQSMVYGLGEQLEINLVGEYEKVLDHVLGIVRQRKDCQLTVLDYATTVFNPLPAFQKLKEKGWPINPEQAIKYIDPELYRFRLERLVVGI